MLYGITRRNTSIFTDWVEIEPIEGKEGVSFVGRNAVRAAVSVLSYRRGAQTLSIRFVDINLATWFCNWCEERYTNENCTYQVVECND